MGASSADVRITWELISGNCHLPGGRSRRHFLAAACRPQAYGKNAQAGLAKSTSQRIRSPAFSVGEIGGTQEHSLGPRVEWLRNSTVRHSTDADLFDCGAPSTDARCRRGTTREF